MKTNTKNFLTMTVLVLSSACGTTQERSTTPEPESDPNTVAMDPNAASNPNLAVAPATVSPYAGTWDCGSNDVVGRSGAHYSVTFEGVADPNGQGNFTMNLQDPNGVVLTDTGAITLDGNKLFEMSTRTAYGDTCGVSMADANSVQAFCEGSPSTTSLGDCKN